MQGYTEIRDMLESGLKARHQIVKGKYLDGYGKVCPVEYFKVTESDDCVEMLLTYREQVITQEKLFGEEAVTESLMVLSGAGDRYWPYALTMRIWEGKYPANIAINKSTGAVYFLRYSIAGINLEKFCELDENELSAVKEDLNKSRPYRISLNTDVMFEYIGEQEGFRALRENIEIEFDCGVRLIKQSDD